MDRCIVGIRQPDGSRSKGKETSNIRLPSLAAALSDDNRRLLRLIHEK
jgi:predicted transcriptional regulator